MLVHTSIFQEVLQTIFLWNFCFIHDLIGYSFTGLKGKETERNKLSLILFFLIVTQESFMMPKNFIHIPFKVRKIKDVCQIASAPVLSPQRCNLHQWKYPDYALPVFLSNISFCFRKTVPWICLKFPLVFLHLCGNM